MTATGVATATGATHSAAGSADATDGDEVSVDGTTVGRGGGPDGRSGDTVGRSEETAGRFGGSVGRSGSANVPSRLLGPPKTPKTVKWSICVVAVSAPVSTVVGSPCQTICPSSNK